MRRSARGRANDVGWKVAVFEVNAAVGLVINSNAAETGEHQDGARDLHRGSRRDGDVVLVLAKMGCLFEVDAVTVEADLDCVEARRPDAGAKAFRREFEGKLSGFTVMFMLPPVRRFRPGCSRDIEHEFR